LKRQPPPPCERSTLESAGTIRERILRATFDAPSFEEAVRLVGIPFEQRIVLSKEFWALLGPQTVRPPLEPLEPQEGSRLVGELFGFDCDALFLAFQQNWSTIKNDPLARTLVGRIEAHTYVEHVEPWSETP
jgi:hypothetical protein